MVLKIETVECRWFPKEGMMSRRMRDDSGAALVEYSMLISLIVAVAFLAVQAFGGSVLGLIQTALDSMP
jgi:Flp pilus assembly pilin Flp